MQQQDRAHAARGATAEAVDAEASSDVRDSDPATPTPAGPTHTAPASTTPDPSPPEPRAAARASLAAGRSPSLWWVCTGLVVVVVFTFALGPTQGGLTLAGLLACCALARGVLQPAPMALTVRSRALDTAVLAALALGVGVLSQVVPTT